jgi:hypothetical protein
MSKLAADAATQLLILSSKFTSQKKKAEQIFPSAKKTLDIHVRSNRHAEAFKGLPTLCSQHEHLAALGHLLECIENTKVNIAIILASPQCPPDYVSFVAPICAASLIVNSGELTSFVKNYFVKIWKQPHVTALSTSPDVPEILQRLIPRVAFSLEELHVFARRFESELAMDFSWLYANYPLGDSAPSQHSVTIAGRALSSAALGAAPPPRAAPAPSPRPVAPAGPPPLPPFRPDEYELLTAFVDLVVTQWNAGV